MTTSTIPHFPDTSAAGGTYGQAKRKFGADDPRTVEALGVLTTARILDYVGKALRDSPPLTDEQVDLITAAAGGAQ
ncbi:hypothetical protein ACFUEJ_22570 [Gordonia sp. NPDC057258]|uniref:hypothetical protein n=1 Tax=unclassified Gordonia (in: high G+C Gram-positive bacteria) TaxID=2657482 RepID=UPI0036459450